MQEVQVLEATRTAPNSRGRVRSNPITVESECQHFVRH